MASPFSNRDSQVQFDDKSNSKIQTLPLKTWSLLFTATNRLRKYLFCFLSNDTFYPRSTPSWPSPCGYPEEEERRRRLQLLHRVVLVGRLPLLMRRTIMRAGCVSLQPPTSNLQRADSTHLLLHHCTLCVRVTNLDKTLWAVKPGWGDCSDLYCAKKLRQKKKWNPQQLQSVLQKSRV